MFPRVLKDLAAYNEGYAWLGEFKSATLPPLNRKMEEYRGGGMTAPVSLDMGMEAMELAVTCGGPMRDVLRQWGAATMSAVYLRLVCNYQNDDTGALDRIEIIVRGRWKQIEMGDAQTGEVGEFKAVMALAYYKLEWNGRTEIEIDPINMVEVVNGVDQLALRRMSLGMF